MAAGRDIGIPDVELPKRGGGTLNPSHFMGHELVVLFCPSDPAEAIDELSAFRCQADRLSDNDAWLIAVSDTELPHELAGSLSLVDDPEGKAWQAFSRAAQPYRRLSRAEGATFLFGRGGCLQGVWPGSGRSGEVVEELGRRR